MGTGKKKSMLKYQLLIIICTMVVNCSNSFLFQTHMAPTLLPINISYRGEKTEVNAKWGPRWNPRPDSEYYSNDDDKDIFGGVIYSGGMRRKRYKFRYKFSQSRWFSLQRLLVFITCLSYVKQVHSAVSYLPVFNHILRKTNPTEPLFTVAEIIAQFLLGYSPLTIAGAHTPPLGSRGRAYGQALTVASTVGPYTMDFAHQSILTRLQPHRYLTSGFLHSSIIHLTMNMIYLWRISSWVENYGGSGNGCTGKLLYLSTYLSCIVAGNWARDYTSVTGTAASALSVGASGGICGICGLMFIMLQRMENKSESIKVLKNMLFLFVVGTFIEGVSNASHIAGFLTGILIGFFFGPTYGTQYRPYSLDNAPRDYLQIMRGKLPMKGLFPLWYLWGLVCMAFIFRPELQIIPTCIYTGFAQPGVLSGLLTKIN